MTPLHVAAHCGRSTVVQLLLDCGAAVNALCAPFASERPPFEAPPSDERAQTPPPPPHAHNDHCLVDHTYDQYGLTPLDLARRNSDDHCAQLLLDNGGMTNAELVIENYVPC